MANFYSSYGFPLISTVFIRWGCNFTCSNKMHMNFFIFIWPTSKNAWKIYLLCVELNLRFSGNNFLIHFAAKNIFLIGGLGRFSDKIGRDGHCRLWSTNKIPIQIQIQAFFYFSNKIPIPILAWKKIKIKYQYQFGTFAQQFPAVPILL